MRTIIGMLPALLLALCRTCTGTGTFNDRPVVSPALAVTVWAERGGKRLAVHHQQTDLVRN